MNDLSPSTDPREVLTLSSRTDEESEPETTTCSCAESVKYNAIKQVTAREQVTGRFAHCTFRPCSILHMLGVGEEYIQHNIMIDGQ